jgi:hypothetical protein
MPMNSSSVDLVFTRPKVRQLILWGFLLSVVLGFGLGIVQAIWGGNLEDPIWVFVVYISTSTALSVWVWQQFRREGIQLRLVMGRWPERPRWLAIAGLILAALGFSVSSFLIAAAVLSYQFPLFVEQILRQIDAEATPRTANLLFYQVVSAITTIVVAPITEEWIFRGFILQRWGVKWNLPLALIVSSVWFGLLHLNPIGLTIFGLIMGLLYIKTRSLLIPIAGHALNNLVATGMMFLPKDANATSIATLRESLPIAIFLMVISAPWLVWYIAKNFPRRDAPIPYIINAQEDAQNC